MLSLVLKESGASRAPIASLACMRDVLHPHASIAQEAYRVQSSGLVTSAWRAMARMPIFSK